MQPSYIVQKYTQSILCLNKKLSRPRENMIYVTIIFMYNFHSPTQDYMHHHSMSAIPRSVEKTINPNLVFYKAMNL